MSEWQDLPIPEDEAIKAAHPIRTGRHEIYAEAQRMVGAKRSKISLIELVNWLMHLADFEKVKTQPNPSLTVEQKAAAFDAFVGYVEANKNVRHQAYAVHCAELLKRAAAAHVAKDTESASEVQPNTKEQ